MVFNIHINRDKKNEKFCVKLRRKRTFFLEKNNYYIYLQKQFL